MRSIFRGDGRSEGSSGSGGGEESEGEADGCTDHLDVDDAEGSMVEMLRVYLGVPMES